MTVSEALVKRTSIRAYLPTPVPENTLREIFRVASRTPSWANSQPWDIFVATGDALTRIKAGFAQNYADKVPVHHEVARPAQWTERNLERQKGIFPCMLRDCGEAHKQFGELNQKMYHAPAVIYLCVDKMLAHWALYDIGAYSQSVMLAAVEHGLSTIPAIQLVNYPDVIKKELQIPDNFNVALGIAIGYADPDNDINKLNTDRDDLETAVKIVNA